MKKYLFIFALLTLGLVDNDASAQTTAKPTNEQLETKITELEKEVAEFKSVDELKSDMQDSLLNKEKDNSSNIYDATMLFIAIVSFFVAVGGIFIGLRINRLNNYQKKLIAYQKELTAHQNKINLVLDSKEFDKKVTDIEQRLATMRMQEKMTRIYNAKRQFRILCKDIDDIRSHITFYEERGGVDDILIRNNWDDTISYYPTIKKQFIDKQDITPLDDSDYESIETLESIIEDLERSLDVFERIKIQITNIVQHGKFE
ncbi:hypothetical protein [Peribacillus simplex]|uniref:hypothetical protein n=1 Tax=Peribacillus simplex TaxID=1478 RepID=UPI0028534434|nr:hypothetical protein [Peribacillus simplex]MDR4928926.1 hypothetical protein [Peribacillus simplex]